MPQADVDKNTAPHSSETSDEEGPMEATFHTPKPKVKVAAKRSSRKSAQQASSDQPQGRCEVDDDPKA